MGRDVSLMVTARDNYSNAISKMAANTRSFEKDMAGLSSRLELINRNKVTLQTDFTKAKNELNAAKKAFQETGDEASRLDMEAKQADYNNLSSNLKLVSDQAKQTERDMRGLTDEMSKSQNRAGNAGSGFKGSTDMLSALGKAGLTHMLGESLSGVADTFIGSAFGDSAGNTISSVISKAATGAAIGSVIPGIGTAVGAVAGAAAGLVEGATQHFEKKNDAFKSSVQEAYQASQAAQDEMLGKGSGIASIRETSMMSWTTMLKDATAAKKFTEDIRNMAASTPFEFNDLNEMAKRLKVYGYEVSDILPTITKIGDAGAALGKSSADIENVARALGLMKQSGKVSLEWLNIITDKGIDAIGYLAQGLGVTNKEVYEMVSKGLIPGAEAAQIIADAMGSEFAGGMELQSKTFAGLASTLGDAKNEMSNAMGEGFNNVRKPGMEKEIAFLDGETGEKMKGAYELIGEWQGSLVNLQEQFERDALTAVMDGSLGSFEGTEIAGRLEEMADDYKRLAGEAAAGSEEAGAEMGALLAEAQAIANSEYMASEGYGLQLEANQSLIQNLQSDAALNEGYYNAGLKLGEQMSKGIKSALLNADYSFVIPASASGGVTYRGAAARGTPTAWGLNRVPYDNYPAMLHQNERVLTASEAAGHGSGTNVVVNLNGSLVVREEADVNKVAQALAREISLAKGVVING